MIDRALMIKWIDALRSGDYPKQIRGFLHTPEGLDAMGVLCDVVDPQGWDIEHPYTHKNKPVVYYGFTYKGISSTYTLPTTLQDALGVEENFSYYMVEMNDKKCLDFKQIADYLERAYIVN